MTPAPGQPTHDQWQGAIRDLASALGWRTLHVRRSIGKGKRWTTTTSVIGWPDLWCYHPSRGGFAGIEAKVGRDVPTPEQLAVLAELEASGALTMVAYPADLPALTELLRHPPGRPQSD